MGEKNPSSQEADATDESNHSSQNAGALNAQRSAGGVAKSKNTACSKSNGGKAEQREGSRRHKLVEISAAESPMSNEPGIHGDPGDDPACEPPPKPSNTPSANSQQTQRDSVAVDFDHQIDVPPTFSPELHPLSLDYCNFPDIPEEPEMNGDASESPWADVVDLFGIGSSSGSNNVGGFFDIEEYFESICACKSDSGEHGVDGQPFGWPSDQWEDNCGNKWQDEEEVDLTATPEETNEGASNCPEMERQMVFSDVQCGAAQNEEARLSSSRTSQCFTQSQQSQQPTAATHCSTQSNLSQGSQASCTLMGNQHFTFEGVAQSFSVPPHVQHCSIPTPPPHEDDWLFTYILKDGASSDFWE